LSPGKALFAAFLPFAPLGITVEKFFTGQLPLGFLGTIIFLNLLDGQVSHDVDQPSWNIILTIT
jgi:hypothetical protein